MSYRIVLAPEARDQLNAIYDYIASVASPDIARRFTDGILDRLGQLADYPFRGISRDDVRPNLRTISWRRRVAMAYAVDGTNVVIVGIFYGGRDFETILGED